MATKVAINGFGRIGRLVARAILERTDHALALVQAIDRPNVGLSFNLCHWLATTPAAERTQLTPHLNMLKPYLKMLTICGANDVVTTQKVIWDDYILPLGTGSFDTFGLVDYVVHELNFRGPIGVQCYNIRVDKPQLIFTTMRVWHAYKSRSATRRQTK